MRKFVIFVLSIGVLGALFLLLQSPAQDESPIVIARPRSEIGVVAISETEEQEDVTAVIPSLTGNPGSAKRVDARAPLVTTRGALETTDGTVLVTRVVDGDTIEIEGGEKVRYIGVNTPESVDPRRAVQCFGKEASAYNASLVEGKRVRLESDVEDRDKYGRLLRYVWIGDEMINERLVTDGYAQLMTIPPNVKYVDLFKAAQTEAREAKRGLWSKCK